MCKQFHTAFYPSLLATSITLSVWCHFRLGRTHSAVQSGSATQVQSRTTHINNSSTIWRLRRNSKWQRGYVELHVRLKSCNWAYQQDTGSSCTVTLNRAILCIELHHGAESSSINALSRSPLRCSFELHQDSESVFARSCVERRWKSSWIGRHWDVDLDVLHAGCRVGLHQDGMVNVAPCLRDRGCGNLGKQSTAIPGTRSE